MTRKKKSNVNNNFTFYYNKLSTDSNYALVIPSLFELLDGTASKMKIGNYQIPIPTQNCEKLEYFKIIFCQIKKNNTSVKKKNVYNC